MITSYFRVIKYAWLEFKKTPCLGVAFIFILIALSMGYLLVNEVKSNAVEVKTLNAHYQIVIERKDSSARELIKIYERTLAVEHFQKQIDSLKNNRKK